MKNGEVSKMCMKVFVLWFCAVLGFCLTVVLPVFIGLEVSEEGYGSAGSDIRYLALLWTYIAIGCSAAFALFVIIIHMTDRSSEENVLADLQEALSEARQALIYFSTPFGLLYAAGRWVWRRALDLIEGVRFLWSRMSRKDEPYQPD